MTEGRRPGGLTALAVLNFVFAAFGGLNVLGQIMLVIVATTDFTPPGSTRDFEHAREIARQIGPAVLIALAAAAVAVAALQIMSGIGYLLQKKVLGRGFGNAYALLSIASTVGSTMLMRTEEGGGSLQLITLVFVIYPLLTLFLINTTFKEDFVR
ncbi:MAG: hypothetical protein U1E73_00200 [Planctomycetota bacterium]